MRNVSGDMDRLHTGDTSGYFNTGIVRGARFPAVNDGLWGKALTFDGDGDHVEVRNDTSLNPVNGITVETWINPSAPVDCDSRNNFRTLISKGGVGDGGYSLIFEEGERFQARVRTGGVQRSVSSSRGIPVGTWSHVGFTYDARTGGMEIFIDGEVVGSATHPAMTLDPTVSPVRIGGPGGARATCPNGDGAFQGRIDEVRISRSVRDLTFSPRPGNHAQFIDQWVPAVVGAGESFAAHLTFRNVGTTAWASGTEHRLGSQAPMDTGRWGTGRIDLPRRVLPGQAVTIIATVNAPGALGDHAFQWQLLQEGAEWFGELSESVNVEVVPTGTAPDAGMPPPIDAGPPPGSDGGMAGGDGGVPPSLDASIAPGYDGGIPPATDGRTSSLDGGSGGGMDGGCSVGGSRHEMPLVFLMFVAFAIWRRRGRAR